MRWAGAEGRPAPPARRPTRIRHSQATLLVLHATIVATLAACTSGEAAPDPTTTTPRPIATERELPDPPVPGESIYRDDEHGAEAAARYFVELYPYVYATGDLTEFEAMSHPDCMSCSRAISDVRTMHDSGEYRMGGEISIGKAVVYLPNDEHPNYAVRIWATENPIRHYNSEGELVGSTTESDLVVDLELSAAMASEWLIHGVNTNAE